jgi:predicted GNAT family N-acyltransferase
MFAIHEIDFGTPEYDAAVAIRHQVLRAPLNLSFTPEELAAEFNQIHLALLDPNLQMVGYLNLTAQSAEVVKMRQVAILPMLQSKGLGTLLVSQAESKALSLGFQTMLLHARQSAIAFYQKLGYQPEGPTFTEVTLPHIKMTKNLATQKQ